MREMVGGEVEEELEVGLGEEEEKAKGEERRVEEKRRRKVRRESRTITGVCMLCHVSLLGTPPQDVITFFLGFCTLVVLLLLEKRVWLPKNKVLAKKQKESKRFNIVNLQS